MTAAPQVRPAPKTIIRIKSPRWTRPEAHGLIQGDGDRGGGGVSVFVEIDEDLLGFGAEAFDDRVNDAAVGLVRDDAFNARDI